MLNRRSLIQSAFAISALAAVGWPDQLLAEGSGGEVSNATLRRKLAVIPDDFIGLGYEMSSVATDGLLSADNRPYVQLLESLGGNGVLRIGGIVADFTRYSPDEQSTTLPKNTVINRANLLRFRDFLDAVGWSVIWSVNFGSGTLAEAIAEAKAVAGVLGPRLKAIELGNEVENYGRGAKPLRTSPYTYEAFRAEYTRWHAALSAAIPTLRFAAPDTAASVEWVERMASDASGDVQMLTTHYYRGDQRQGTMEQLLKTDFDLIDRLKRLREASEMSGIPWRMCETNSFFGGGRPGVSDTLGGALWTLDFMLLLARYGCAGVNIETGVNQLGFISSYSPIQDDGAGRNYAGAPYYGMLAFAAAVAKAPEVLTFDQGPLHPDFSAYALGRAGRIRSLTLINKSNNASVSFPLESLRLRHPEILQLAGPSLNSKTGITFGGEPVEASGRWSGKPKPVSTQGFAVPPASAVLIRSA